MTLPKGSIDRAENMFFRFTREQGWAAGILLVVVCSLLGGILYIGNYAACQLVAAHKKYLEDTAGTSAAAATAAGQAAKAADQAAKAASEGNVISQSISDTAKRIEMLIGQQKVELQDMRTEVKDSHKDTATKLETLVRRGGGG